MWWCWPSRRLHCPRSRAISRRILAFEGEGHVEWFEGNFEDYEQDKLRRLGAEAAAPHRMTHKRLTR